MFRNKIKNIGTVEFYLTVEELQEYVEAVFDAKTSGGSVVSHMTPRLKELFTDYDPERHKIL